MSKLTLFGHQDSGHACKVALALSLAKLTHKTVWVDIWAAPESRSGEFLSASPLREVPLLKIDQDAYTQSGAILLEIATRFKCLGGQDAKGLQRGRELLMWEANRFGMCLPQLKEARRVNSQGLHEATLNWLEARYEIDRNSFDRLLDGQKFFHGNQVGIGDCAIWGYAQWLDESGVTPTVSMSRWIETMRGLAGMKRADEFYRQPS